MNLKDVVETVKVKTLESRLAFNAGHHDTTKNLLGEIRTVIEAYFSEQARPAGDVTELNKDQAYSMADGGATKAGDVTESAINEKPADAPKEKPDEVPFAQVRPAAVVPDAISQQEALDQADG